MTRDDMLKKAEELGILNIEAYGDLTDELLEEAINIVKEQNSELDFEAISKRADNAEKQYAR
ncbi:MAG: hypothetical protein ACTTJ6_00780 [Treponema sp.]